MTDSNIAHSVATKEINDLLMPETGFSDKNLPATDYQRSSEGNECLNTVTPVATTQEPLLQGQTMSHGNGLDSLEELVDVKVCDICGDAGREALLALCSVCSDGAEHTYCMRNKMDKVPENGWMCEECIGMHEPLDQTEAVAGRVGSASNPSSSKELSKLSPRKSSIVPRAGKRTIKYFRKTLSLSGLRRGPSIEMRSGSQKRKFEESIRPSKARTSSMKSIMDKEKTAAPLLSSFGERPAKRACEPVSSSGHRSLISEKRFSIGTPYKRETDDVSKSKVKMQQSKDVLLPRIDSAKENADNKLRKNFMDKKFLKSLSFAGSATSDAPPQFFSIVKSKGLKCGIDGDLPKHVPEKKITKITRCSSSTRSCSMNVPSSKKKVVSEAAETLLVLNKSAIIARENSDVKTPDTLAKEGKKFDPVGEKLPSSHSSDAINCLKKDANSSPGCRQNYPTLKAKLNNSSKDSSYPSAASEKVLRHELHSVKPMSTLAPVKNVPSRSSAVPAAEYIWKGGFKLEKSAKLPNYFSGVQAHVSSCASSIHEVVLKFGPKLEFKEVSRSKTWHTYFPRNCPTEEDIALYFFAEDMQSYRRSYKVLLDGMMSKDLVLEASFDGIQLLVLPSSLLPVSSQRWNSLFYLWGVCKVRKVEDQRPRLGGLDVAKSILDLCTPVTNRSPSKCISTVEDGSFSPSQTSHNSIQGPETVQPLLLQSSALYKSSYQSCHHDTTSVKCLGVLEEIDMKPDTAQSVYDLKQETLFCRASGPGNMLEGIQIDHSNINCTSKAAIFPFGQANKDNTVSLAINSGGNGLYSENFHSGPDIASHSSFSIDSGPSGSSDGCARSDEKHKEQLEKPSSSQSLSLDLCLGFNSQPEEQVNNLDLMLGFPGKSQPEPYTKIRNAGDRNMSLFLSLGMPCSNA